MVPVRLATRQKISTCRGRPVSWSVGTGRFFVRDVIISRGSRMRKQLLSSSTQPRSMSASRWWAMCFW
jgi:hypothetical protein